MRTPRFLIAAATAALTITALAGCANVLDTVADVDGTNPSSTPVAVPDGRFGTPLESHAGGTAYARANWVRLPDGRKVLCVSGSSGGFDCNWDDIRPGDAK